MDKTHDSASGSFFYGAASHGPAPRSCDTASTPHSARSLLSPLTLPQTLRTPYRYSHNGRPADRVYGSRSAPRNTVDSADSRSSNLRPNYPNAPPEKQGRARQTVASRKDSARALTICAPAPSYPTTPAWDLLEFEARRHEVVSTPPSSSPWAGPPDSAPPEERYREPRLENSPQCAAALTFSPDSQWIASGSSNGWIFLWTTAPFHAKVQQAAGTPVHALAFSPDGRHLASAHQSGHIKVWSIEHPTLPGGAPKLTEQRVYHCSPVPVLAISWYPDGTRIATCSDDTSVHTLDLQQGVGVGVPHPGFGGHPAGTLPFAHFSPDGTLLAFNSPGVDSQCEIRNVENGTKRVTLPPRPASDPPGTVRLLNAQFDALSTHIALCSSDRHARVFTIAPPQPVYVEREVLTLTHHTGPALDASFSPDGKLLLTATAKGNLRFWWRLSEPAPWTKPVFVRDYRRMAIRSVRFSPDGRFAACASSDGDVRCGRVVYDSSDVLDGPGSDAMQRRSQSAGSKTPCTRRKKHHGTHPVQDS